MPIHLRAEPGDYAEACLLPGDPLRAKYIAETFLEDVVQVNGERGLLGFTGTWEGKPVSVQGTGMGCPCATIVIEELIQLGVKRLLRVGTCGGLQPDHALGDLIVAISAVPADATATHLVGGEPHCPTAGWELVHGAVHVAKQPSSRCASARRLERPLLQPRRGQYERWSKRGMLAVEMEAAVLFTLGALKRVHAGCLLTVSDIVVEGEFVRISDEELRAAVDRMTRIALATATAGQRPLARGPSFSSIRPPPTAHRPALARDRAPRGRARPRPATRTSPRSPGSSPRSRASGRGSGRELLVVVGGDGTVHEVVNGVAGATGVELAVIPRGTGWDFARTFGIPRDLERRCDVALDGRRCATIDLGPRHLPHWAGRRARSLFRQRRERRHERRDRPARERHLEGARRQGLVLLGDARRLRALADHEMRVAVDGETRAAKMIDVIVANGRYLGGGMKICPEAEPDDGLFDVLADRRHHEARPDGHAAEALPRHASAAPEGRAPARARRHVDATSRCRSSSTASSPGRRRRGSRSSRARSGCAFRRLGGS